MAEQMTQTFVPMSMNGRTRLVQMDVNGTAEDSERVLEEQERIQEVAARRLYFEGEQYFVENEDIRKKLCLGGTDERLPEHKRKHAYSTQIADCVSFLANRLGSGFSLTAKAQSVADVIDAVVAATPVISAETEEGEPTMVVDELIREALVAQDVPVYVGWDLLNERPFLELWESERVEFVMRRSAAVPDRVIRTEVIWATDDQGIHRQIVERLIYELIPNVEGVMECRVRTYWDGEEEYKAESWLGIGRLPWARLRVDSEGLREYRGKSPISRQAMETADRFNAIEQTGFLIARYNSHSNIAVIGDGASLKMESEGRVHKDVADVLTFPGGTGLEVLTLPTETAMIEHQRNVLAEALYQMFGVTRVEPDTLNGLGQVSGYALEILNEKSEGTFKRFARYFRKDLTTLVNLVLDVTAWKRAEVDAETMIWRADTGLIEAAVTDSLMSVDDVAFTRWWETDPAIVFPDRTVQILMGGGYVVDAVRVRDDFTADLISRGQALRERGYDPDDIRRIEEEIDKAAPPVPEAGSYGTQVADLFSARTGGSDLQAGSTVASGTNR